MTTNFSKKSKGFSLVETLIAIAILLVAVVGPIGLIGNALHNLYYARDEMVAINLAQEGIEVVRQKRDSNMLSAGTWDAGLSQGDYVVTLNTGPSTLISCPSCGDSNHPVYSFDGFYAQGTSGVGLPTQFTRLVTITSLGVDERKVTSTVTWNTGNQAGTISVSENLFRWAITP